MEKARMLAMQQGVVGGTEGGRSPTGVPPTTPAGEGPGGPAGGNGTAIPDPAVPERPVRRRFTAEYKLRVLREADRATGPGQLGALLRREGLYSSHLTTWRKQREEGTLAGLTPKRRGRKANPDAALIAGPGAVAALNAGTVDTAPLRGAVLDLDHIEDALDLLLRRDPARDAVRVSLRHTHAG